MSEADLPTVTRRRGQKGKTSSHGPLEGPHFVQLDARVQRHGHGGGGHGYGYERHIHKEQSHDEAHRHQQGEGSEHEDSEDLRQVAEHHADAADHALGYESKQDQESPSVDHGVPELDEDDEMSAFFDEMRQRVHEESTSDMWDAENESTDASEEDLAPSTQEELTADASFVIKLFAALVTIFVLLVQAMHSGFGSRARAQVYADSLNWFVSRGKGNILTTNDTRPVIRSAAELEREQEKEHAIPTHSAGEAGAPTRLADGSLQSAAAAERLQSDLIPDASL